MNTDEILPLKNVLCIRVDNMGDLLMSTPAFGALKETHNCKITVLTSSMGALITPYIEDIDDTIVADVPWVKTEHPVDEIDFVYLVQKLAGRAFDAAIIFTVYSQNPLPAAMLAFLSGIPVRAAYCRENPYHLLTHWIPDEEPHTLIQHQVERDVKLAATLGAFSTSNHLSIFYKENAAKNALQKMKDLGIDTEQPFVIFHPGVSENKRQYPIEKWIEAGTLFLQKESTQIIITGSLAEQTVAENIQKGIGKKCYSTAGIFSVEELIAVIDMCQLLVSVNTGTVHIAAALRKPIVVLYALTNPQHTPWQTPSKILYFSVEETLKSKNQVVNYVSENKMHKNVPYPTPVEIVNAIDSLLKSSISN